MPTYSPKRGHHIEDTNLKEAALQTFSGEIINEQKQTIEEREVHTFTLNPDTQLIPSVTIGQIYRGSKKDHLYLSISELPEPERKEVLLTLDTEEIERAASLKIQFLSETTGYTIEQLKNKDDL